MVPKIQKIKRGHCYTSKKPVERKMSHSATGKGCGECQFIWDGKCKGKKCLLGFEPVLACDVLGTQLNEKWGGTSQNVQIVFNSLVTEYVFLDMYSYFLFFSFFFYFSFNLSFLFLLIYLFFLLLFFF